MSNLLAVTLVAMAAFYSCCLPMASAGCFRGDYSGYYLDCRDAFEQGQSCSGVYTIKPDDLPPFSVYCDMETDGGGWTVFQRRMDGTLDFYRDWIDYVRGFGDLEGEFWLGLSKIHRLAASSTQLRVYMNDFSGNTAYAKYKIQVGDSSTKYQLTASGYTGTAGDSLTYHSGSKFSTRDQDNDGYTGNCAQSYKGGWWYYKCHLSNLNGLYLSGNHASYANGVNWQTWKGYHYSLKVSEMMVRRP